jgi:hypothetical protein
VVGSVVGYRLGALLAARGAKLMDGKTPLRTRVIIRMISPWINRLGKSPGSWKDWSFQIRP